MTVFSILSIALVYQFSWSSKDSDLSEEVLRAHLKTLNRKMKQRDISLTTARLLPQLPWIPTSCLPLSQWSSIETKKWHDTDCTSSFGCQTLMNDQFFTCMSGKEGAWPVSKNVVVCVPIRCSCCFSTDQQSLTKGPHTAWNKLILLWPPFFYLLNFFQMNVMYI